MLKAYADAGNWVTINGVHVLIGGNGKIVKGPAKFIGSTVADMKNVSKSTADKKAELKKKLAEKKAGLSSKDEASKQTKSKSDDSGSSFKPTKDSLRELQVGDSISFTNSFGEKETFVKTTNPSGRKSDPPTFVYADESGNPKSMSSASNRVSVFGPSELAERASLGQGSATVSKGAVPDISKRVNQKINGLRFDSSTNDSKVSSKATKSNPTGMTLKERGEAIRKVKGKYQNADSSTINKDLEKNKKIMQSSEIGTEKYTKARINVLALQDLKSDRNNSSMTTEQMVGFMSSNTLVHSGGNPSKPLINPAKVSGTIQQKRFSETAKSVSSNTSGSSKYPSGITTPAQKRAYTRAINSGMSSSDAKKSALGKATNTSKSDMSTFKKGATTTSKTTNRSK